jgi:hypothetical protein
MILFRILFVKHKVFSALLLYLLSYWKLTNLGFLNGKSGWPKKLTSSVLAWTFLKTHSKEMLRSNSNIEFPFIRQLKTGNASDECLSINTLM